MRWKNRDAKDALEFYPNEDQPVIFKAKQLKAAQNQMKTPPQSPDTIFSSLANVPPPMKLPQPKATKATVNASPTTSLLPPAAVWGGGRKVWTSRREQEILDQWLDEVKMTSRARMPAKAYTVWSDKERADKSKHRSLTTKYWIKRRSENRALLAHEDMQITDKLHRIAEDDDDDEADGDPNGGRDRDNDLDQQALLHGSSRKTFDYKPRNQMARRAKVRRAARREARDSKCYRWDDWVEAEAARIEVSAQLQHETSKWRVRFQQQQQQGATGKGTKHSAGKHPYPDEVIETLLMCYVVCCEPKGPAVSNLRSGGVALSMAATCDLEDMLRPSGGIRKRTFVTSKDDALIKPGSSPKARTLRRKTRGTKQLLVAPKMVKAYAGKRGC